MGLLEQYMPKKDDASGGLLDQYMPKGGVGDIVPAWTGKDTTIDYLFPPEPERPWLTTREITEEMSFALYRPIGAYLKTSVESLQLGLVPHKDPFFGERYIQNLTGKIEDIQGKAITEPVAQAVLSQLPREIALPLGTYYYGGYSGAVPDIDRTLTAMFKTMAERGELGKLRADDFKPQTSPAGFINFAIESLGLDWFIPSGAIMRPFGSASRAIGKTVMRQGSTAERIAGLFSRHLGPGAPVNKIADEFTTKLTRAKGKIGFGEAKIRRDVLEVLGKYDVDVKRADPLIDEIVETYSQAKPLKYPPLGKPKKGKYKPPQPESEFFVTPEQEILLPGQKARKYKPSRKVKPTVEELEEFEIPGRYTGMPALERARHKFFGRKAKYDVTKAELKPGHEGIHRANIIEKRIANVPPEAKQLALRYEFETIPTIPTLEASVRDIFPEITKDLDVKAVSNAIDHYIHIGKQGLDMERSAGIPIKQLGGGKNYMLHYLADEAREVGGFLRRTAPKFAGKEEARLVKDIFHPSLLKRSFDITIKQGNDLAAAGRVYVKGGKIGLLKAGEEMPKGAKAITKLFEDDPMRLAVIRQVRTARAVTTKEFLDDVWDELPDFEGEGGVTLFSKLGKKKWAETFELMGDAADKYKDKLLDPEVARTIMFGVQRMHDFKLGTKPPMLAAYDAVLNWWKPIQLYFYPKYHTRNFGTAQWNEFMNDNLLGMMQGHAEILGTATSPKNGPRLIKHPLFEEAVEWGVLGRSQFTADIERGLAFGTEKAGVHKLGEWMENFIRFSSYIGWKRKGLSPRLAARKVAESQFDYLDLTWFEWNVMRRMFPFYTFSRKNIPFQISRLLDKPAKGAAPLRGVLGAQPPYEPGEEEILPPQVKDRFPVKVGNNTYLAMEDSWAMFDIGKLNPAGGKLTSELIQMLSPFIKMPIEQYSRTVDGRWTGWGPWGRGEMTGYSLFTGRPIKPWWKGEDDLWGQPTPVKVAHALENTFRFFREVEKSPWYPEDEGKPIGQSKFAKSLQFWGVPYYESHPQQQINWRIKELKNEQEEMGGLKPDTARRYKDAAFKIIALRGMQDQMLEPFRGGKRIVHKDDAVLDELSNMTGVDMKAIRTEHGSKWREVAMYTPNVFVDFGQIRKEYPGKTEDEIRRQAFDVLEREAKSNAFFKGGVENISDAITTIINLLYFDDNQIAFKRTPMLSKDEREWLQGTLIGTLMSGVEYLDENRRSGGSEWYDYADKMKEWSKFIKARTGKMPENIQKVYQEGLLDEYSKLKTSGVAPSAENFDELLSKSKGYTTDEYLSSDSKDYWWGEWESTLVAKYDWFLSKRDFDKFEGGSQLGRAIKDDGLPIEIRRRLGKYYALKMKTFVDVGVKNESSWKWVEDNVAPLFIDQER